MDESKRKEKQQKLILYIGAFSIVFILPLFAVLLVDHNNDANKINANAEGNKSDNKPYVPTGGSSSASFPALHFSSSGRLPTKLRSFQLGMSVADALSTDPSLVDCQDHKTPPSTSVPDINLCQQINSAPKEFDDTLTFSRGRLVLVMSEFSNLSSEDAALFNEKIQNQLGKPDVAVYAGPSRDSWVWIDGDVRIQYLNRPLGTTFGARDITAQLAAYPEFLITLGATTDNQMIKKDDYVKLVKRGWGEESGQVILKPLPRGLDGLQLRMTLGQVRAARPGIVMTTLDDHRSCGELKTANDVTNVCFWDGIVSGFAVERYDIAVSKFSTLHNSLIVELGTPSGGWPGTDMETIEWEDRETKIGYTLFKTTADRPSVYANFADKRLDALTQAAESSQPPQYKHVSGHSFF